MMGFEPTTIGSTNQHSTAELHPQMGAVGIEPTTLWLKAKSSTSELYPPK